MRAFNFSPRSFSLRRWPMCSEDFLKIQRSLRSSSSSVYFISVRNFISWSYLGIEWERLKGGLREWENERERERGSKKSASKAIKIENSWLQNWTQLFFPPSFKKKKKFSFWWMFRFRRTATKPKLKPKWNWNETKRSRTEMKIKLVRPDSRSFFKTWSKFYNIPQFS